MSTFEIVRANREKESGVEQVIGRILTSTGREMDVLVSRTRKDKDFWVYSGSIRVDANSGFKRFEFTSRSFGSNDELQHSVSRIDKVTKSEKITGNMADDCVDLFNQALEQIRGNHR